MNNVNEVAEPKKLSIEKTTIRNLTADEADSVGGGTTVITASSTLCLEGIAILVSAAVC